MRHQKVSRRLTTTSEHRIALMRNQVRDLLKHGRIITTLPKAKELRRHAERIITLAKRGDLASRRRALAYLQDKAIVKKLFTELREKYLDRPGGYTRIVKLGERRGDGAFLAIIELVEERLTFKKSKQASEGLKKLNDFIEKKRKEYGLASQEGITQETVKDEASEASSPNEDLAEVKRSEDKA